MEEAKAHVPDLCVRYALSAFEDLNSAIRNLRRCFGFPYQEYIGYLNTLTKAHRARREHENLVDRLRRWAIFGNVDAVVWIDYSKANQPPGSFKMGPRDSRPFGAEHMELCVHGLSGGAGREENDGEESEAAWSDPEDEHGASAGAHGTGGSAGAPVMDLLPPPSMVRSDTLGLPRGTTGRSGFTLQRVRTSVANGSTVKVPLAAPGTTSSSSGGPRPVEDLSSPRATGGSVAKAELGHTGSLSSRLMTTKEEEDHERTLLRSMIQEEVIPAHGSIYKRTITPGPGYYSLRSQESFQEVGATFGHRPPGRIDEVTSASRELPGPCEYRAKAGLAELRPQLGRFGRAEKLVAPVDVQRKLPFISRAASARESHGVHGPSAFHAVAPDGPSGASAHTRPPKYSFGRLRRPF